NIQLPVTLTQPSTISDGGYTYEASLTPAHQITVSVSQPEGSRGFILYAKRKTSDEQWTSVGKTTNGYAWAGSETQQAYTAVLTIPQLARATDLTITAVVIDNNEDPRQMRVEATAGGVTTYTVETTPTHGNRLNIPQLVLRQVPTGTQQISITLKSPSDNGDSLVLVGVNVSHLCSGDEVDLAVTKTVNNPTPIEGEIITYTVAVTNHGPEDATGVQITDT
ncbi:MAG: DUF11 domain-containing protein, partial [Chloroflexi bacterium]|nr:DUF11 domain-containing protein [Chloroflexota bacterium]